MRTFLVACGLALIAMGLIWVGAFRSAKAPTVYPSPAPIETQGALVVSPWTGADSDPLEPPASAPRKPDVWDPKPPWTHGLAPVVVDIYRRAPWCDLATKRGRHRYDNRDFLAGPGEGRLRPNARPCS